MNENKNSIKGAFIDYCCIICNLNNNFEEDFSSQISRIKSDSCNHFNFKFIYNLERGNIKYMISFNCKKCGKNKIIDFYNNNSNIEPNIHYKCFACNNGDMNFRMLLKEDHKSNQTFNMQNNQSINNIGVIGGNAFQNNNNIFPNIMDINMRNNNNFIFNGPNNMFMNQNMNNMNMMMRNNNLNNICQMNNMSNMNMGNKNNMGNINNMGTMNNRGNVNNICQMNNMSNINIGNMNIGNANNINLNNNNTNNDNNSSCNQNDNNPIELIFKDTEGQEYKINILSFDCIFSEVACQLIEKYPNLDSENIRGFLCEGKPIKNYKTLKENNIEKNSIILIYKTN